MNLAFCKNREAIIEKSSADYEASILQKNRFELYVLRNKKSELVNSYMKGVNPVYNPILLGDELKRLRCSVLKRTSQMTFYLISKIGTHLFESINVDRRGIQ